VTSGTNSWCATADLVIVVDGIAFLCVRRSQKTDQQRRATL